MIEASRPHGDIAVARSSGVHGWGVVLRGLVLLPLVIVMACSSLSQIGFSDRGSGNPESPGLPADYDVLVGEIALAEGDFEAAREALLRASVKDPESGYLQLRLGRIAAQLDDLDGAIVHARQAVERMPGEEDARIFLGGLYRMSRNVEGAQQLLLDAEGRPISETAALLLYRIHLESDRLADAERVAEGLIADDPENLGGYMALATVYERMSRPESAERVLREALERDPDRFVLYSRIARLKRALRDTQGEIAVYQEILAKHPHHHGSLLSLGEALVTANDLDGAIEVYAEIGEHYPDDMNSLRRFASLEFAAGRSEQAKTLLESGLARFPHSYGLAYSLGQVHQGSGDLDAALEAFERIPPLDSHYYDARLQIVAIHEARRDYALALRELNEVREIQTNRALDFHAAGLRLRSGDYEGGKAILDAVLAEDSNDEEALYQLGVFYGLAKKTDLAIETMMKVLEINSENAHALNYVGYTWAERGENLEEAEALILRALEQRPNDGFIADSLGWVYYMRGRDLLGAADLEHGRELLLRARDQLKMAAELTGGDPVVSEHLGDVYWSLDDKERAYDFYREAVEMEHREDEQPNLLQKLDTLRRELGEQ